MILYIALGAVVLVALYMKGYLGLGDLFAVATVKGVPGLPKRKSSDAFAEAVRLAMEEAHEEVASVMAKNMRDSVVKSHAATFPNPVADKPEPKPEAKANAS